jgi:hypothetical protein
MSRSMPLTAKIARANLEKIVGINVFGLGGWQTKFIRLPICRRYGFTFEPVIIN